MQTQPLFSALVANYNNGKYIAACLDSLLAQDYPHVEIIIVDDASTDNSVALIEKYVNENISIKFFKNEKNQGVGFTKNKCVQLATGSICGFVDPDDAISFDAIEEMVKTHLSNPDASLIYSNYYECDEQLNSIRIFESKQVKQSQSHFFNQEGYIGHFATFKKACYLNTKGINPILKRADDQDLYFKLYDVGTTIHLPKPLYYYRFNPNGVSTLANTEKAIFERWYLIFEKAIDKNIPIEDYFLETFVRRDTIARWLKLDQTIRGTKIYQLLAKLKK